MTDGKIPVRTHEVPLSNELMAGGTIQISTSNRSTEDLAEERIESGIPHSATDTRGEWKEQGLTQCKRCGQPKAADEYRKIKTRGIEYQCLYCLPCEAEMKRTRRFSQIIPLNPYPKRLGD